MTTALPASALAARPRSSFSVLRHRDYLLFWASALISNSGSWMQTIAVPFVIFQLTHSTTWLGFAAFMSFFPSLAMGPVSGSLADRFPRKTILLVTQTGLMIVAFAMWGVWIAHAASAEIFVVLLLFSGLTSGVNITAWQSFVPQLVPERDLLHAVRLNTMQFTAARAVGPAIAGLVLAVYGAGVAFLVNAVTFLLVLGALVMIHPRSVPRAEDAGKVWEHFRDGASYVRRRPTLWMCVLTIFVVSFLGTSVIQLAPALAVDQFGVGKGAYGILVAMFGSGAIVGSVVVATWGDRVRRSRMTLVGMTAMAAGQILLGSVSVYAFGCAALFVMGMFYVLISTALNTSIQARVDEEHRGRVMAIHLMCLLAGVPFGALILGKLASVVGLGESIVGFGVALELCVVVAVVRLGALRAIDQVRRDLVHTDPLLVPPDVLGAD
ncbi:MAG TPA: MFS transporter [Acidimicrobiia bacterium]|nr:MFS transporter [Acidimicrobiia bacterium]